MLEREGSQREDQINCSMNNPSLGPLGDSGSRHRTCSSVSFLPRGNEAGVLQPTTLFEGRGGVGNHLRGRAQQNQAVRERAQGNARAGRVECAGVR